MKKCSPLYFVIRYIQLILRQFAALSCPWASHNTPRQLRGGSLWLSRIRGWRQQKWRTFHWLTCRHVGKLQMSQNNVTLPSEVILWAAPSHNTKVWFAPPGLVPLKPTITQTEIRLSFHNFSRTFRFHYHLVFDVGFSPGIQAFLFFLQATPYVTTHWTPWISHTSLLSFYNIRYHVLEKAYPK